MSFEVTNNVSVFIKGRPLPSLSHVRVKRNFCTDRNVVIGLLKSMRCEICSVNLKYLIVLYIIFNVKIPNENIGERNTLRDVRLKCSAKELGNHGIVTNYSLAQMNTSYSHLYR